MENATKALLIAASVFLTIMLISLVVVGYNRISEYYSNQSKLHVEEQANKFNKQFQGYNRQNVRGSELISFMNKVIDYNAGQSYEEGTNYERIKVTIEIDTDYLNDFMYGNYNGTNIIRSKITNITSDDANADKNLVAITNTPSDLIKKAQQAQIENMTDSKLQKLTNEIYYILVDETSIANYDSENRRIRKQLIKSILNISINTDEEYYKTSSVDSSKMEAIKEIVSQYYQYTMFKRAYFECVEMKHNTETGRVNEMHFKVQTKTDSDGKTTVKFE